METATFSKKLVQKSANSSNNRSWNIVISCLRRSSFTAREFMGTTAATAAATATTISNTVKHLVIIFNLM
jgi:hypothetical protein